MMMPLHTSPSTTKHWCFLIDLMVWFLSSPPFFFSWQWIFWVGPFVGAAIAAFYHQYILRAGAMKALGSFRSNA